MICCCYDLVLLSQSADLLGGLNGCHTCRAASLHHSKDNCHHNNNYALGSPSVSRCQGRPNGRRCDAGLRSCCPSTSSSGSGTGQHSRRRCAPTAAASHVWLCARHNGTPPVRIRDGKCIACMQHFDRMLPSESIVSVPAHIHAHTYTHTHSHTHTHTH